MRVELEKILKQQGCVFLIVDALERWKIKKLKKIYGGPKKLSSFQNAGKLAFSQPSFNAATSLCTKSL